ncbi:hypothetical protein [Actinomycetospora soli]|uniref:hypothetical protein n=1 Tax=Actinomycetospora soli TaxID=2893887 RepID=UPI001E39096D|nr:hypothetical protein [Actinomycetospora soli]MCD2191566.1 hypothetical protein [Actinomycetospora soli]
MLIGAQIGSLEATWGNFLAGTGEAFNADYITVVKNAYLEGARIKGALRMIGASIGGQLDCTDLRVDGADEEDAFLADSVKVADSLMLAGAFISGNTWLLGSQIGGQLNAVGALLMSLEGTSLNAAGISVEGTVDLQGAYIYGTTSFSGAHVQGEMNFKGSRLFAIGEGDAVDLSTCSVGRTIYFDPLEVSGRLNLTDAKVQTWDDLGGQKPEELSLVGFTYDFINVRAMGTRERVNWLRLQRNYSPQPYAQLISTLRKMGDDRAADRVGISSQWTRRRQPTGWRRTPSILWSALLASLIGFGYAPARALWWFAGLLTVGAYGAHMLARLHQLVPRGTSGTAPFNPVRYTVDLLFPIAQLREADDYVAIGAWAWFPFSYQLIGWLLGAIFVAGLTGVFRRS